MRTQKVFSTVSGFSSLSEERQNNEYHSLRREMRRKARHPHTEKICCTVFGRKVYLTEEEFNELNK